MEQLIKIPQDPIPFEQHSLSHTAVLSRASLSLLMSQLPERPPTPTVKSLLQKTRLRPAEDGTRNNCPERDGRSYSHSCKVSLNQPSQAFWWLKINAPPDHPAILQLPFSMSKTVQREKHISVPAVIQDLFRGKYFFPMQENSCNVQHGCSTFTCDESDHRDNELLE